MSVADDDDDKAVVNLQVPPQGTPTLTVQVALPLPQPLKVSLMRSLSRGTNQPAKGACGYPGLSTSALGTLVSVGGSLKVNSGLSINYSVVENLSSVLSASIQC